MSIVRDEEDHPSRVDLNYRSLLEVTNVLNSQRDTESLFRAIAQEIKKVIPWERAGIPLYHPESDTFRFYAVETTITPRLRRDAIIPRKGSAVGWVYDNHRLHVRPNLHEERLFLEDEFYFQEGLGRMINLPLLVRGSCFGCLNIGSVETGEPDPKDLEFLRQVAMQIALALDIVRAYEQINRLKEQLSKVNEYLVEEIKLTYNFGAMVGNSQGLKQALMLAQTVAPTDATVLITGETGTGKELLSRAIHEMSARKNKPFVGVNCAALPLGLVESELFGHERGAFTGAHQRRLGRFELAHGGTLFLDEVGELHPEIQAKLLRVLQDGYIERVGGKQPIPVDVRIIAATNRELAPAIAQGRFRPDLFYRLNVFPISILPLCERREDIPLLARYFAEQYCLRLKRPCREISEASFARLLDYPWPGNVRELQNVIERSVILCTSPLIEVDKNLLPSRSEEVKEVNGAAVNSDPVISADNGGSRLLDLERAHIEQILQKSDWRIDGPNGAARRLGMNPSTLRSRLKKLGIRRPSAA